MTTECALCAVSLGADDSRVLYFGPEGCGASPSGGDSSADKAEAMQLFESEVDAG